MSSQIHKDLWPQWAALWNGNLALADEIIASDFVAHFAAAGPSPSQVQGPEALKQWIGGTRAAFANATFTTSVGPLADDDLVAGRWIFRATYQGGMPGASSDAIGKAVEYAGMDIFRVKEGRISEYWLCADILQLLQQIGVIPS